MMEENNRQFEDERAGEEFPGRETLRLVTQLSPPEGLTERVHARVRFRMEQAEGEPRSFWSLWGPVRRLQFAGAAVLVLAVAGSMWSVRHGRGVQAPAVAGQGAASTVAPAPVPAQQPTHAFGSAGAERHPASLTPIKVPPAPKKKKPSASRTTVKRVAPVQPAQAASTPQ